MATEWDEYILGALRRLVSDLLCKMLPKPPSALRVFLRLIDSAYACLKPDSNEESRRVETRFNNMAREPPPDLANFWADRTRDYSLAVILERVEQVRPFVESCRAALDLVNRDLFPLSE
jgi:hypothetical protein